MPKELIFTVSLASVANDYKLKLKAQGKRTGTIMQDFALLIKYKSWHRSSSLIPKYLARMTHYSLKVYKKGRGEV